MIGAIRRLDILAHPFVTIHCFGWGVFFRALTANHDQTFLSLLIQTGTFQPPKPTSSDLVERCIKLELQAKRIYEWLEGRFLGYKAVSEFFANLARQEGTHAELLGLCREAARRTAWKQESLGPWREVISRLERQMAEVEATLDSLETAADGLQLVLQIEGSEINQVFSGVVAASRAGFVRKVRTFQEAAAEHISSICEEIPRLEPALAERCRQFRKCFLACTK